MLLEADITRMALVDERGCRRDIRSNGWIDFRESSLFQNRSGRRNEFSSFGAESLLRNFTGPKARLKSGPDVFADALVPGTPPFPGTSCVPTAAPLTPGILIFPDPDMLVSTAYGLRRAVAERAYAPPRIGYAVRPDDPSVELLQLPARPFAPITTRAKYETPQWLSLCEMPG